jgi:hypothetical protein
VSNWESIAAVTATLQSILLHEVPVGTTDFSDLSVSILPLDKARATNTNNQLNLFLYLMVRNAAFSNNDMPGRTLQGDVTNPPLPLNLYYLVTAFGQEDDAAKPFGHELLGKAMSVLFDHPVLSAADISNATQTLLPGSDLANQVERIRITFHPLTMKELAELWTGFSMQYRLSAAYEVDVVLIESTRSGRSGLPVLMRGPGDQGPVAQSNLLPPVPTLTGITLPNSQTSARQNDVITLTGLNLNGSNISVQFSNPLLPAPVPVLPMGAVTATALTLQIPTLPTTFAPGFYTVSVSVQRPGENFLRTTNAVSLALAPTVTLSPASAPAGTVDYTATVSPEVLAAQSVSLLLGSTEYAPGPRPMQTGTLTFAATGLTPGTLWFRLRVDGVDSILVDRSKTPPVFDPTQQVTVT